MKIYSFWLGLVGVFFGCLSLLVWAPKAMADASALAVRLGLNDPVNPLSWFEVNGQTGYVNSQGQIIIPPTFDGITTFGRFAANGLAWARDGITGKYGYINVHGQWEIKPVLDGADNFGHDGLAKVTLNGKKGYLTSRAKWVIPPEFDDLQDFNQHGLAPAKLGNSSWGFIDKTGRWMVSPQFYKVQYFKNYDMFAVQNQNGWGFLSGRGKMLIAPRFNGGVYSLSERNEKSEITLIPMVYHNGLAGVITPGGQVIEPQFNSIVGLSADGVAGVMLNGKWGFFTEKGRWLISPQFEFVGTFSPSVGLAPARKDGLWGYVNQKGDWMIEPQYELAGTFGDSTGLAEVRQHGAYGYIDRSGRWVREPYFEEFAAKGVNGLTGAMRDGLWGFINSDNEWVIKPQYESFSMFRQQGLTDVVFNGQKIYINERGETVIKIRKMCGREVAENRAGQLIWPKNMASVCANHKAEAQENVVNLARSSAQNRDGAETEIEALCRRLSTVDYLAGLTGDELTKAVKHIERNYSGCLDAEYDRYNALEPKQRRKNRLASIDQEIQARRELGRSYEEALKDSYFGLMSFARQNPFPAYTVPPQRLVVQGLTELGPARYVALSHDRRLLTVLHGTDLIVYETASRREVWRKSNIHYSTQVNNIIITGTLADEGEGGSMAEVVDLATGRGLNESDVWFAGVLEMSPDSRYLLVEDNIHNEFSVVDSQSGVIELVPGGSENLTVLTDRYDLGQKYGPSPHLAPYTVAHSGPRIPTFFKLGRFWLFAQARLEDPEPKKLLLYDARQKIEIPLLMNGHPITDKDVGRICPGGQPYFEYQDEEDRESGRRCYWGAVFSPDGAWLATVDPQSNIHFFAPGDQGRHLGTISAQIPLNGRPLKDYRLKALLGDDPSADPICLFTLDQSLDGQFVVSVNLKDNSLHDFFPVSQERYVASATAMAVSGDDVLALGLGGRQTNLLLVDLKTGAEKEIHLAIDGHLTSLRFSTDGRYLAAGSSDGKILLFDPDDKMSQWATELKEITSLGVGNDGRTVWAASSVEIGSSTVAYERRWSKQLLQLDVADGRQLMYSSLKDPVKDIVVDDRRGVAVVTTLYNGWNDLYNTKPDMGLSKWSEGRAEIIACSPLGVSSETGTLLLADREIGDLSVLIYDLATRKSTRVQNSDFMPGMWADAASDLAAISPDKSLVFMHQDSYYGGTRSDVYSTKSGHELVFVGGHDYPLLQAAFLRDSPRLVTRSVDGIRLWDLSQGTRAEVMLHWVFFQDGNRVVIDRSNRFDTPDLDSLQGVHWVADSIPGQTVPMDGFMRDYYQPRLAEYVLRGQEEILNPVTSLDDRNLFQAKVDILGILPETDHEDEVSVVVEVAAADGEQIHEINDLKLFRDGRLVAVNNGPEGRLDLSSRGLARVVFSRIPLAASRTEAEFKAYAFNSDRVRSQVAIQKYAYQPQRMSQPRLHVVALGVNEFDDPTWRSLEFAANDALAYGSLLPQYIRLTGGSRMTVLATGGDGQQPLKRNLRQALTNLGNREDGTGTSSQVSTPDDVVIIALATHGVTDEDNTFYLLPADIGKGDQPEGGLAGRAVSANELSEWLARVDAGEIIMIIDACQSGAAFGGRDFKPGPMGDQGLGQLAYDKAMRVLCATNEVDDAKEIAELGHGLLTHALLREGLEKRLAGHGRSAITFSDWLIFGRDRTALLHNQYFGGSRGDELNRGVSTRPEPFLFNRGGGQPVISLEGE